jgi:hypothetical protein
MTPARLISYNNVLWKNSFVMDLKETIISSFFGHIMLLLLMAAVSSYSAGLSGNPRNVVSVDLIMEKTDLPEAADEPLLTSSEEISLPDQTVKIPSEEAMPEPEKEVETSAEPPKIAEAEKPPVQPRDFSMEEYYQFIMLHKQLFGKKAGDRINALLGEALKVNTRHFYGGTAMVSLKYGPDGKLSEVLVDSESPELKAFFEEIVWDAVPAPAQFSLSFTGIQIEFTVLEGYMSFKINAL